MRAVVQRTNYAYVTSEGTESGRTGPGLMVLLGVSRDDTEEDARYMADKICHLRIFEEHFDDGVLIQADFLFLFRINHHDIVGPGMIPLVTVCPAYLQGIPVTFLV